MRNNVPGRYDNHPIKIITIDGDTDHFTAPLLPGGHYNISLSMYTANNILVEKTTINMTDVLGVFFDKNLVKIDPGLDPETHSLYEFTFTTGIYNVEAGFSIDSTTIWSQIYFIFIN